ncbi:hypothetical protein CKAH01_13936 [Colletotrichum kahawae]|uniref:Uncharacterized protein n=1 Tax=Colletotrichum kahawae TaxID=34407 RepID=A0AAD9YNU1_COLKA|nr:hypothetical protein CKAH01_13936 [Colletotrichum kahawae]
MPVFRFPSSLQRTSPRKRVPDSSSRPTLDSLRSVARPSISTAGEADCPVPKKHNRDGATPAPHCGPDHQDASGQT